MKTRKKEILESIVFSIAYDNRKGMINRIMEYASEEFEDDADFINLAKSSKKELRITLNNIFIYYLHN